MSASTTAPIQNDARPRSSRAPAQRGDPHQERRAAQPALRDGDGAGGRGLGSSLGGPVRGQAGGQKRVPRHGLEHLARERGVAPRDPSAGVDLDELGVRARPEEGHGSTRFDAALGDGVRRRHRTSRTPRPASRRRGTSRPGPRPPGSARPARRGSAGRRPRATSRRPRLGPGHPAPPAPRRAARPPARPPRRACRRRR